MPSAPFCTALERGSLYQRFVANPADVKPVGHVLHTLPQDDGSFISIVEPATQPPVLERMCAPHSAVGALWRHEHRGLRVEVPAGVDGRTLQNLASVVSRQPLTQRQVWEFAEGLSVDLRGLEKGQTQSVCIDIGAIDFDRLARLEAFIRADLIRCTDVDTRCIFSCDRRIDLLRWFYQSRAVLRDAGNRYFRDPSPAHARAVEDVQYNYRTVLVAIREFLGWPLPEDGQSKALSFLLGDYSNVWAVMGSWTSSYIGEGARSIEPEVQEEWASRSSFSLKDAIRGALSLAQDCQVAVGIYSRQQRVDSCICFSLDIERSIMFADIVAHLIWVLARTLVPPPDLVRSPGRYYYGIDINALPTAHGYAITVTTALPRATMSDEDAADLAFAQRALAAQGWGALQAVDLSGFSFLLPNQELYRLEGTELIPLNP